MEILLGLLGLAILGESKDEAGKFALFCFWGIVAMIGVGCCAFTFSIGNILFPGLIRMMLTMFIGLLVSTGLLALLSLCLQKFGPAPTPTEPPAKKEE